jgi:FKBP-type peptidyl-prolyl cis-trans isomerase SlyD
MNTMQIGQNKVVSVTYRLQSNQNGSEPTFVEETGNDNPLVFLFGTGQLIPEFKRNLENLTIGSDFEFHIEAENAYGMIDEEARSARLAEGSQANAANRHRAERSRQ